MSMQLPIHYGLPVNKLSSAFDYHTNSYKYYWFLSILEHVNNSDERVININSLLKEMTANAWYPVSFFRLSFGKQDKLQNIIIRLESLLSVPPDIKKKDLIGLMNEDDIPGIYKMINSLGRYVPYRFLTSWFSGELRGIKDTNRNKVISNYASNTFESYTNAPLYKFSENGTIILHNKWLKYLKSNYMIIRGFIFWHLLNYLKTKNPNVPNLQEKLIPPLSRGSLALAKRFWRPYLHKYAPNCIYSLKELDPLNFCIDHYLPWNFVAHNDLWNLVPTIQTVNSSKSDNIPSKQYLEGFISLQYSALRFSIERGVSIKDLEDYSNLFKESIVSIYQLERVQFYNKLKDTIIPLTQIAVNSGFCAEWNYINQ